MSDGGHNSRADRLGFPVPIGPLGHHMWPPELKQEAVRRVRDEGAKPKDLAFEIGARENLVHKWVLIDRRARGE